SSRSHPHPTVEPRCGSTPQAGEDFKNTLARLREREGPDAKRREGGGNAPPLRHRPFPLALARLSQAPRPGPPPPSPPPLSLHPDASSARIGSDGPRRSALATLREVHRRHALAVPFENLDVLAGRPIRLDPAALMLKLVAKKRGGYCFEQNALLRNALTTLGF